jgi:hypothetical protein
MNGCIAPRLPRRILPFWMVICSVAFVCGCTPFSLFDGLSGADADNSSSEIGAWKRSFINTERTRVRIMLKKRVDELYKPVFTRVPMLADAHYSIFGEARELFGWFTRQSGAQIQTILFDDINYSKTLDDVVLSVDNNVESDIADEANRIFVAKASAAFDDIYADRSESAVMKRTRDHIIGRYRHHIVAHFKKLMVHPLLTEVLKENGVKIVERLANRIAAALEPRAKEKLVKFAGKKMALGLGARAGHFFCWGTPLPVVKAACFVIEEKISISFDEYLHRDAFEAEIRDMIDQHKQAVTAALNEAYSRRFDALEKMDGRSVLARL